MKLYMIRKTLENGVKEYASSGMTFSTKSSKGWGRIGNLKLAIKNRLYGYHYSSSDYSYDKAILNWIEWENRHNKCIVEVLEIDIDNVTITTTEITEWYNLNMKEK